MMESGSPGGDTDSKPLMLPGGMWSSPESTIRTTNDQSQDATQNPQLLFIAVEYVNDGNVNYNNINASSFTSTQEFSDLDEHLSPIDSSNITSTNQYSPNVYSMNNNETNLTNSPSSTYNDNSFVILSNNSEQITQPPNGFTLSSVEGNLNIFRQVVTNRLCRQVDDADGDLKEENEPVELLITDQDTGISYSLSQENSLAEQQDINRILNNLDPNGTDVRLRLTEDRLLDSQSLVLDSNHLISLEDHVLMDNGTLVLKSDLPADLNGMVQHIDLNSLDPNISTNITENYKNMNSSYLEDENIEENHLDEIIISDPDQTKSNMIEPVKVEENEYTGNDVATLDVNELSQNEVITAEENIQTRRSKRQLYGKDLNEDDDGDLFSECPDCILGSSVLVMCARHRMLSISDKPVPSRARATLPATYLSINKVGTDENGEPMYGVFARKFIPKRTQFGPVEGVIIKDPNADVNYFNDIQLMLESETGVMYKIDTSNENLSNWMRFVRKAETYKQQNLVLNQMGPSLYYITTCNIFPRQELTVGYSTVYAQKRGLSTLPPEPSKEWTCFECNLNFTSSKELEDHLSMHDYAHHMFIDEKKVKKVKHKKKRMDLTPKKNVKDTIIIKDDDSSSNSKENNVVVSSTEKDTLSEKENEEKNYICKECKKVFELSILLEIHSYYHQCNGVDTTVTSSSDEQFSCPECETNYSSRYQLAIHVSVLHQVIVKNSVNSNKCSVCCKSFTSLERLQKHMLVHTSDDSKPLQCNICTKGFLSSSALTCHLRRHKSDKITFECPICKKIFNHVLTYKEHVKTHCLDGIYTCPHCKKEFKEYSAIRKHIRAFHCDRKHICNYCNKVVPTSDKLKMHMLKHSDHREFLCATCGKQFKRKDKLKEHTKRMHDDKDRLDDSMKTVTDNKQDETHTSNGKKFMPKVSPTDYHRFIYKCHTCLVGFKRRGMLVNHLAKRHPDIRPDSVPELNLPILRATRDYYCQYCEKVYKSSSKRKAHILKNHPGFALPPSRTREMPDISGLINPTFTQTVGSVTTNPHNCQWCHKQYASKAKLLQHQRNKHPEMMTELKKDVKITNKNVPDSATQVDNMQETFIDAEHKLQAIFKDENKTPHPDSNQNSKDISSEYLNTDGFDTDILLTTKDNNSKVEQFSREILHDNVNNIPDEYRLTQNHSNFPIISTVPSEQDTSIPVGDSVLRALLTSAAPTTHSRDSAWPESSPFSSYIPPPR